MKYGITRRVASCSTFIDVSADDFSRAKSAKSHLMESLYIEEKLNYVLENFVEFERELLDAALDNVVFSDIAWTKSVSELHAVNRRIVNLLATCRLYLDHVAHNLHNIYGRTSRQSDIFTAATKTEYDAYLGYRALSAMRNYVQHRGFPAHLVTRNTKPVATTEGRRVMHTVIPMVDVSELGADKDFKKAILRELQEQGSMIDLRPLIREFIASIGRIHLRIREVLKDDIASWESIMKEIVSRFCDASGEDSLGVAVVIEDESGNDVERVSVFDDFMTRRQGLERKNLHLTHFAIAFVTSATNDVSNR